MLSIRTPLKECLALPIRQPNYPKSWSIVLSDRTRSGRRDRTRSSSESIVRIMAQLSRDHWLDMRTCAEIPQRSDGNRCPGALLDFDPLWNERFPAEADADSSERLVELGRCRSDGVDINCELRATHRYR